MQAGRVSRETGYVITPITVGAYVASMVTKPVRIRKNYSGRLYLKEHREAKGISAEQMAGRLGIERESVYRLERQYMRVNVERQLQYAEALGIKPAALWRPPKDYSLDDMVEQAPQDVQAMIVDIVKRMAGG